MDSKKFVWGYLIYNRCVGVPSYWGGTKYPKEDLERFNCDMFELPDKYISEIESIGIDWEKTKAPHSDRHGVFNGTDNDPDYQECLRGQLVLKNGIIQEWTEMRTSLQDVIVQMPRIIEYVQNSNIFK